jgi:4-hydroxybenzoate polyprenyltransferase
MLQRLNVFLKLARVSNLPTVWSNCIVGWVLGGGDFSSWLSLFMLMLGASLAYSAGMVMNDVVDAGFDSEHRPERPLPSGEIKPSAAWGLAIFLIL